jgi:PRA1 family protein
MNFRDFVGDKRGKEIEEEIGHAIELVREHGWKDLRTATEFFSVFKAPQLNKKNLEQRVITNFLHYRSNYVAICMGIFLLRIVFAPLLLLCVAVVASLCTYVLVVINKPISVGEIVINCNGKRVICGVGSLVFLAMCGALERLLWTMMYCIVLCALHMVFRPRSVTSKSGKLYDELKLTGFSWFGGENAGEDDPESAMGAVSDEGLVQSGMTSAYVRKRTAPFVPPTIASINSGKSS